MKKNFITYLLFVLCSVSVFGQNLPSLLIDNVSTQFSDVSLPYWLKAGQTINIGTNAQSVSILEFTVNGSNLEFSQTIALKTAQTVPANKVWKIEAIGLKSENSAIPASTFIGSGTSSSSTASLPTIFQSPKKFETPGTYSWTVPPGVTSICIEAWSGGGGGGGSAATNAAYEAYPGGGGGGGGYAYQCFTVVQGTVYDVNIGAGGQGAKNSTSDGLSGGSSSVGNLIQVIGGEGGKKLSASITGGNGGLGGYSSNNTFTITGSNGANGGYSFNGDGKGGNGANGGDGGVINMSTCVGVIGNIPSGGGSGAKCSGNTAIGGYGARGQIYIYW